MDNAAVIFINIYWTSFEAYRLEQVNYRARSELHMLRASISVILIRSHN